MMRSAVFRRIATGIALLGASMAPALAQTTVVPVAPQTCAVTAIVTGGTAVTAFTGPANGFMLQNTASPSLFYSLSGAASTTEGGGTFALATGQWFVFPGQMSGSASLSVNAAATQSFACMRW